MSAQDRGALLAARAVRIAKLRRDYGSDFFAMAWLAGADQSEIIEVKAK